MLPHGPEPEHELFRYLSEEEITRLSARMGRLEAPAGMILVEQHEQSTGLYVIDDGAADVVSVGSTREVLLNRLGPGQIFGEISMVDHAPRTARVRAATPMKLLLLGREEFLRLSSDEPALFSKMALAMLESLCRKFRESLSGPN